MNLTKRAATTERLSRRAFLETSGAATLAAALGSKGWASHDESVELLVCPTDGKVNLRNSEGSVINLTDGSLLLVYTRFRGGSSSDFAPADIVTRTSSDGGRTWREPRIIAQGLDTGNVLSASMVRLRNGAITVFYGRLSFRKGPGYTRGNMDDVTMPMDDQMMRISTDEGKTWSEERNITMPGDASQVLLNDNASRLSTGRLLLSNYHGLSPYSGDPEFVQPLLSDDDGKTWSPSRFRVCLNVEGPGGLGGLSESAVTERGDGSLLMTSRTTTGFVYHCHSRDGGETWSKPEPTDLPASGSPTSLKRVPGSNDLLLLWNQVSREEWELGFARHRLTAAISSDGGKTWRHRRNLESLNERTYIPPEEGGPLRPERKITSKEVRAEKMRQLNLNETGIRVAEYSSLLFVGNKAVITYDVVGRGLPPGVSLKLRVLPISWFYENK